MENCQPLRADLPSFCWGRCPQRRFKGSLRSVLAILAMLALSGLRVAPGCSVRPFPLCPPVFARLAEVQMKSEPLIVISPLSMPACTGGGSREPKMEFAGIYVTRDKVYSLTACSYDEVSIFKTEYPHQLHSYKKSYSTHNGSISKGLSLEIKKIIKYRSNNNCWIWSILQSSSRRFM